ncbi:MAG: hypothetical protein ACPLZG_12190, partial [Thermoproteota archaeon]
VGSNVVGKTFFEDALQILEKDKNSDYLRRKLKARVQRKRNTSQVSSKKSLNSFTLERSALPRKSNSYLYL